MRTYCIFSFLYFLDTLFLHCDSKPCTYVDIYVEVVITVSPISSCVVSFLSLCTCFLYIVCNILFLFQKYRLLKSFLP